MIANIFEKIKNWLKENEKDFILSVGVFLIAVISFGLGVITSQEAAPIIIENPEYRAMPSDISENPTGIFVASIKGKYYHLPECPGARNISEINKIWFQTKAEAEKMGYKPASNCPDLQNY